MTLNEIKEPFERIDKKTLDEYGCNKVVELYLSSFSDIEKNRYISYLICKSWNLVNNIYYKNNKMKLTSEECYDIFIQALQYVISNHVWTNEESTLYQDEDAFMKAMAITIESRKKNYIHSKFRQKRVANMMSYSLDSLEEDFQEGYFSQAEPENYDIITEQVEKRIKFYFGRKHYLAAFILEAIIFNNVFTSENELDDRKLRKILRNIDENFCKKFAEKYSLNVNEVKHSLVYFSQDNQEKLDAKIRYAFLLLKQDDIIKQILDR